MAIFTISRTELGTILFDNGGPTPLPTALASEIARDVFVQMVEVYNDSAGDRTVEIYDGGGAPLVSARTVAKGEVLYYHAVPFRRMKGGVQWKADAAGCTGYIAGFIPVTIRELL